MAITLREVLVWVLTFFIPPLGVFIAQGGKITNEFWISLLLTLLAWLPGVLFSFYVIGKYGVSSRIGNGELNEPIV